jgi:hypothetical protein
MVEEGRGYANHSFEQSSSLMSTMSVQLQLSTPFSVLQKRSHRIRTRLHDNREIMRQHETHSELFRDDRRRCGVQQLVQRGVLFGGGYSILSCILELIRPRKAFSYLAIYVGPSPIILSLLQTPTPTFYYPCYPSESGPPEIAAGALSSCQPTLAWERP